MHPAFSKDPTIYERAMAQHDDTLFIAGFIVVAAICIIAAIVEGLKLLAHHKIEAEVASRLRVKEQLAKTEEKVEKAAPSKEPQAPMSGYAPNLPTLPVAQAPVAAVVPPQSVAPFVRTVSEYDDGPLTAEPVDVDDGPLTREPSPSESFPR